MVYTVLKVKNSDPAAKSVKELIVNRNSNYDLRGSDILKLPKDNTATYGLISIVEVYGAKTMGLNTGLIELYDLSRFLEILLEN